MKTFTGVFFKDRVSFFVFVVAFFKRSFRNIVIFRNRSANKSRDCQENFGHRVIF